MQSCPALTTITILQFLFTKLLFGHMKTAPKTLYEYFNTCNKSNYVRKLAATFSHDEVR